MRFTTRFALKTTRSSLSSGCRRGSRSSRLAGQIDLLVHSDTAFGAREPMCTCPPIHRLILQAQITRTQVGQVIPEMRANGHVLYPFGSIQKVFTFTTPHAAARDSARRLAGGFALDIVMERFALRERVLQMICYRHDCLLTNRSRKEEVLLGLDGCEARVLLSITRSIGVYRLRLESHLTTLMWKVSK
jgi:hypothetical protein